jgi:hypothetical protein
VQQHYSTVSYLKATTRQSINTPSVIPFTAPVQSNPKALIPTSNKGQGTHEHLNLGKLNLDKKY